MIPLSLSKEGLAAFRRSYRWLNLTLVQHGVWPLLVAVFAAPATPVALTPLPWYWARLAAPVLAALLALAYLAQRPRGPAREVAPQRTDAWRERDWRPRNQGRLVIAGVAILVAALRLVAGPLVSVLKLEAFGLADAVAYQTINFGLADRSTASGAERALPVALFGLSWGLRDLFLAAVSPVSESPLLAFAGGAAVGLVVGAVSCGLRRWPGGSGTATAFQFLVVSLVIGYWGVG